VRFEHGGTSLWYGTSDAPAPLGVLGPDDGMTVTVAVRPIEANNRVDIFFRLTSAEAVHEVNATWLWNDGHQNIQYYRAVLPHFQPGDHVEYTAVCSGAGRQVPASPFVQPWPAQFSIPRQRLPVPGVTKVHVTDVRTDFVQPLPEIPATLFVADDSGFVHALQAETGAELWDGPTGAARDADISKVTAAWGVAYVGCEKDEGGAVVALDAADGHLLWSVPTLAPVRASPEIYDDLVIVVDGSARLHALFRDTGELKWVSHASGTIRSPVYGMHIQGSTAYVVGASGISAENLERPGAAGRIPQSTAWTIGMRFTSDPGLIVLDDVLYVKDDSANLWAINQADGKRLWMQDGIGRRHDSVSQIAISEGVVYWGAGNQLCANRVIDGKELWNLPFGNHGEYAAGGIAVVGKAVLIAMEAPANPGIVPTVVAIDADTQEVKWRSELEGIYANTPLALLEGTLLFGTCEPNPGGETFRLCAINASDGTTKWKSSPFSSIYGRQPTVHGWW
jgi:outer membrane protein assembly factor BamB